jgi:hypothetical protein
MKTFVAGLVLCLSAVGTSGADVPIPYVPASGGHNVVPGGRDACWSEPADLNGLIGTSEIIDTYGLVSELANDFVVTGGIITKTIWWGGQYGVSVPCMPEWPTPGFNLRFYEDAQCLPGGVIADLSITDFTEESLDCIGGFYPIWKWSADISVGVSPGVLYWFGAQYKDHTFPGQGGRLTSAAVIGCEGAFKSAFFGYPDWVPGSMPFGSAYDFSQEFECGATPTRPTTWGVIRGLYH